MGGTEYVVISSFNSVWLQQGEYLSEMGRSKSRGSGNAWEMWRKWPISGGSRKGSLNSLIRTVDLVQGPKNLWVFLKILQNRIQKYTGYLCMCVLCRHPETFLDLSII